MGGALRTELACGNVVVLVEEFLRFVDRKGVFVIKP